MVPGRRSGNGSRCRFSLPFPLVLGFVVGFASAYTYYLLANYEDGRRPTTTRNHRVGTDGADDRHFHLVDTTRPGAANVTAASVRCLVFVRDVDSVLMQRNVWLDKCDDTVYASRTEIEYLDGVVTDTYSTDPWKHLCRTLVHVNGHGRQQQLRRRRRRHDWTFVAKDNLWLIHENLVRLVSLLDDDRVARHGYHAGRYVDDGTLATDAGVLLSASTFEALVRLLDRTDACNADASDDEGRVLDFYLKQINSTPVANMDSYGCSMFNSINLFEAFDPNSLKTTNVPQTCLSRSAISFQLDLFPNYYAMFYKYVLYQIRLVNSRDLMSKDILPPQYSDDIWRIEALYELNLDPTNMTQTDFYHFWSKKRQIIL